MKYRSWLVYLQGKRIATMTGEPIDHDEALAFARFHWRDAVVEPNEGSLVE